jgi:repressor of nif and glnA expression
MPDEYDIYAILKKHKIWMTSNEIAKILYKKDECVCGRYKVQKKLKSLAKFKFIEEKKRDDVDWNEYRYRCL